MLRKTFDGYMLWAKAVLDQKGEKWFQSQSRMATKVPSMFQFHNSSMDNNFTKITKRCFARINGLSFMSTNCRWKILTLDYTCDETAIWLDMLSDSIFDVIGAKQVPIKTTSH